MLLALLTGCASFRDEYAARAAEPTMKNLDAESGRRYTWCSRVEKTAGGPILVADLEDYLSWNGSQPSGDEDSVHVVRFYGPLVRRLPAKFQPQGAEEWHQSARVTTLAAARTYAQELTAAVTALEPAVVQRAQLPMDFDEHEARLEAAADKADDSYRAAVEDYRKAWRDHREQGVDFSEGEERVLHFDIQPDTDYDRGCDALKGSAARIGFGSNRHGVLWEFEGSGTADVALADDRASFLLLQTWVDEESAESAARAHVTGAPVEQSVAEVELLSGRAIAAWSALGSDAFAANGDAGASLRAAAEREPPVQSTALDERDVATVLRVRPGVYRVACGMHKAEGWSCHWARFTRLR